MALGFIPGTYSQTALITPHTTACIQSCHHCCLVYYRVQSSHIAKFDPLLCSLGLHATYFLRTGVQRKPAVEDGGGGLTDLQVGVSYTVGM